MTAPQGEARGCGAVRDTLASAARAHNATASRTGTVDSHYDPRQTPTARGIQVRTASHRDLTGKRRLGRKEVPPKNWPRRGKLYSVPSCLQPQGLHSTQGARCATLSVCACA